MIGIESYNAKLFLKRGINIAILVGEMGKA